MPDDLEKKGVQISFISNYVKCCLEYESFFQALCFPQYKEGKPEVQKTKLEEIELRDIPEAQSLKINGEIQQVTFQRIISTCTVGLIMQDGL